VTPRPPDAGGRTPRIGCGHARCPRRFVRRRSRPHCRTGPISCRCLGLDALRIAKTGFVTRLGRSGRSPWTFAPTRTGSSSPRLPRPGRDRATMASSEELAVHQRQPSLSASAVGASGIPVLVDGSLLAHPSILVVADTGVEVVLDLRALGSIPSAPVLVLTPPPAASGAVIGKADSNHWP
jgi:hypothetical protein